MTVHNTDPAKPQATPGSDPNPNPNPTPAPPADPNPPVTPPADPGKPPAQPVPLALKLPDGAVLDQQAVERLTAKVQPLGVSAEHAQQLLEHVNAEVAQYKQTLEADAARQRTVEWVNQAKADPEIGGAKFDQTVQMAAQARSRFFTPEFDRMLDTTGLGNHPEFIRAWSKVGQAMAESGLRSPGAPPANPAKPKTLAQQIYPNMPSEADAQ